MAGFLSLSGSSTKSKQNFYGFKYDPITDTLTIEEYLWGDSTVINLPELNDDGSLRVTGVSEYISSALTPYEFNFSWDTTNTDQLIMEVN
jgi:hypothetical protein